MLSPRCTVCRKSFRETGTGPVYLVLWVGEDVLEGMLSQAVARLARMLGRQKACPATKVACAGDKIPTRKIEASRCLKAIAAVLLLSTLYSASLPTRVRYNLRCNLRCKQDRGKKHTDNALHYIPHASLVGNWHCEVVLRLAHVAGEGLSAASRRTNKTGTGRTCSVGVAGAARATTKDEGGVLSSKSRQILYLRT